MKYIDRLRAEIEKERKIIEDTRRGCGLTEYGCGRLDAFRFIDSIIDSLQQEQPGQEMLDKTLDVAAEESAISQYSMSEIDEELDVVHSRILHEIGFKAGAKWMAGQGVTLKVTDDTTWGEVNDFIHRNCDGVKEIQIRKK